MDQIKDTVSDQYPGSITDIKLEKHGNQAIYEVEITGDQKKYELNLDGKTGEVLELKEIAVLHANDDRSADQRVLLKSFIFYGKDEMIANNS